MNTYTLIICFLAASNAVLIKENFYATDDTDCSGDLIYTAIGDASWDDYGVFKDCETVTERKGCY